jgi:hypothetical protein
VGILTFCFSFVFFAYTGEMGVYVCGVLVLGLCSLYTAILGGWMGMLMISIRLLPSLL